MLKLNNYSDIHSERVKQRSLERDVANLLPNPYFKNREDFVKQQHKQLFVRPADFKYKSSLYFTSTPSPRENDTFPNRNIIRVESKDNNSNKIRSIFGSYVVLVLF